MIGAGEPLALLRSGPELALHSLMAQPILSLLTLLHAASIALVNAVREPFAGRTHPFPIPWPGDDAVTFHAGLMKPTQPTELTRAYLLIAFTASSVSLTCSLG